MNTGVEDLIAPFTTLKAAVITTFMLSKCSAIVFPDTSLDKSSKALIVPATPRTTAFLSC